MQHLHMCLSFSIRERKNRRREAGWCEVLIDGKNGERKWKTDMNKDTRPFFADLNNQVNSGEAWNRLLCLNY